MASLDTQFAKVTLGAAVGGFIAGTTIQYTRVGKQVTVQIKAAANEFATMTGGGGILTYADIGVIGELLASDYRKLGAAVHSPWIVSAAAATATFYVGGYCELEINQLAFKNFAVGAVPTNVAVGGHVKNGCLYYILP